MKKTTTPPLTWLRAFEATGRLGSFKEAAALLNVSPSTISHQVRDLEQHLGTLLLSRGTKSTALTEEGKAFIKPLSTAFELIGAASDTLTNDPQSLRIGGFPFLVHEVLTPNVAELKDALNVNKLSLNVETNKLLLTHPDRDKRLDVLIRYSSDKPDVGLFSQQLFDIRLVPIQAAGNAEIKSIDELLEQPVVKVVSPFDAWSIWREAHGLPGTRQTVAMETDSYHAAVMAVAKGYGICLGIQPFISPWLREGKIKAIEPLGADTPHAACIVTALHNRDNATIQKLSDWIKAYLT